MFEPANDSSPGADVDELGGIITRTPRMRSVLDLVRRYAAVDAPVLIQGETGTGKELIARALHSLGPRAPRTMAVVDCGSLPEHLADSELFGHERGAFTGADRAYAGRIEEAAGGTVFLDEVNAISLGMQAKLLRFLERREFCRLGQTRPIRADVRFISACNVPLEDMVQSGRLRADFFYRLHVLRLDVPALRERPADIPLLVERFLVDDPMARRFRVRAVAPEVIDVLARRPWPGNVRELLNCLRRAVVQHAGGEVLSRLPDEAPGHAPATAAEPRSVQVPHSFRSWMREREREYLGDLLRRFVTATQQAAASGLPQRTLYRKLKRLGLRPSPPPRAERCAEVQAHGLVEQPGEV